MRSGYTKNNRVTFKNQGNLDSDMNPDNSEEFGYMGYNKTSIGWLLKELREIQKLYFAVVKQEGGLS